MLDGVEFGNEVVALVRGYVEREVAPLKAANEALQARVTELEKRPAPEKGEPGESIDPFIIEGLISASIEKVVKAFPKAKDGKDAANIVEALKDSGELVLTLQDGRLIRTGIRDGVDGKSAEPTANEDWAEDLTLDEKTGLVSSMLRKELGDDDLIVLPEPISSAPILQVQPPVVVHNHLPKRGIEKTVVTKHDERGRILEFERREA